ncbi:MAG: PTS sugar transporter subunit IIA [Anaerolineales bacterium]
MENIVTATLVGLEPEGWREAIRAVCAPLLEAEAIQSTYIDRCIEMVDEHGPYMVVAPGIALAHARPEDGVLRLCLSVATLSDPVLFHHPQNDPVDLILAFGSPDNQQHIHLLTALAEGLSGGLADDLRRSSTQKAAEQVMEEVLKDVIS